MRQHFLSTRSVSKSSYLPICSASYFVDPCAVKCSERTRLTLSSPYIISFRLSAAIVSITPDLLYINRQAVKVVNRVGGPRRYFYLPVLYLNDVSLNFLVKCKTSDHPPKDCDIMQKTVLKALDVIEGLPLIVKTFGRPLREFLDDED